MKLPIFNFSTDKGSEEYRQLQTPIPTAGSKRITNSRSLTFDFRLLQNFKEIQSYLTLAVVILGCLFGITSLQQPKLQALTKSGLSASDYQQAEGLEKVKLDILKNYPLWVLIIY